MRNPKAFKLRTIISSFIALAILFASYTIAPIDRMKESLLQSISATSSVAQTSLSDLDTETNASFQVAKKLSTNDQLGIPQYSSQAELLDLCKKMPHCLAKLGAITSGQRQPLPAINDSILMEQETRNEILMLEEAPYLLSWLNPFQVDTAYAQTPVSIKLTPGTSASGLMINLFGAHLDPGPSAPVYALDGRDYFTSSQTENEPHIEILFTAPHTGTYLINVVASQGKAKMRHAFNGPILDTWDFSSEPGNWYDYLTAEYLKKGTHFIYFWPVNGQYIQISFGSVQSYHRL